VCVAVGEPIHIYLRWSYIYRSDPLFISSSHGASEVQTYYEVTHWVNSNFQFLILGIERGCVHLVRRPLFGPFYQLRMMTDDDECGAVGGILGSGKRSTRRKPAPVRHPTWPDPGSKPNRRSGRTATKLLNYGTTLCKFLPDWRNVSLWGTKHFLQTLWMFAIYIPPSQYSDLVSQSVKGLTFRSVCLPEELRRAFGKNSTHFLNLVFRNSIQKPDIPYDCD
jgi:hypothetical protein